MIQYRVTEAQIDGDTSEKKKRKGKKNLLRMAPQLTNYVNRVFTWNKISEYAVDLTRFLQNYVVTNGRPHTQYLLDFLDKLAGVTVSGSKQSGLGSNLKGD